MSDAFFTPDGGDHFVAGELTRGPWDNRFQHGGPPAALLAGAMARLGTDADAFSMARVTVELLRPVPIARLRVEARMERSGRTVQRLAAELYAEDRLLMTAQGLRILRTDPGTPEPSPPEPWPAPAEAPTFHFPFFQHEVGYHRAVELRIACGSWGTTPVGFWARSRVELVAGRATLPLERLLILADAQSGMGVPLDPRKFTFLNPDLTVYLERAPVGSWFGFDIRSEAGPEGVGLSQSAVRDEVGLFARSAQCLVVARR